MKVVNLSAPGGLERLALHDAPEPDAPAAGEITVRLHASSLNFHDYKVVTGAIPTVDGRIPMADGAGVVTAVGRGVTEFVIGSPVVSTFFPTWHNGVPAVGDFSTVPGDGVDGYARERVVRPAEWFTRAPRGYSHAESATLTTAGVTAWRALVVDGGLKAGDTVLVMGTGGVSIFALQIAKAMGALVVATSSSDAKLERLRALGAAHTINYRTEPSWGEAVRHWADGRGVDHVVEIGGPGTLAQSIVAARVGGHISLIGTLTGVAGPVPTALMMIKQIRLQGLIVGSRQHQQDFVQALEAAGIRPILDRSFGLEELPQAFRHQESGRHFGKISIAH